MVARLRLRSELISNHKKREKPDGIQVFFHSSERGGELSFFQIFVFLGGMYSCFLDCVLSDFDAEKKDRMCGRDKVFRVFF